jgi:hypothetical protein
MSVLDQLREKASKREVKLRRKKAKKEIEERELQKVRKEILRAIGTIYIESFASKPPLAFHENIKFWKKQIHKARNF